MVNGAVVEQLGLAWCARTELTGAERSSLCGRGKEPRTNERTNELMEEEPEEPEIGEEKSCARWKVPWGIYTSYAVVGDGIGDGRFLSVRRVADGAAERERESTVKRGSWSELARRRLETFFG